MSQTSRGIKQNALGQKLHIQGHEQDFERESSNWMQNNNNPGLNPLCWGAVGIVRSPGANMEIQVTKNIGIDTNHPSRCKCHNQNACHNVECDQEFQKEKSSNIGVWATMLGAYSKALEIQ